MELSLFSAYYTHPEIQVYWEVAKNEKSGFLCVKEKRMKLLVIDIQKGITDSRLFNNRSKNSLTSIGTPLKKWS